MRRVGLVVFGIAAAAGAYGLLRHYPHAQAAASERHVLYYVDPMHPSYTSDQPGIAPDCGMKLVPVYSDATSDSPSASMGSHTATGEVSIDEKAQKLVGIQVAEVQNGSAARVAHFAGRVVPEDTRIYTVNSNVDGFIRETYDDAVGTAVKKDQKLAAYYAADFLAAASGYLAATERVPGAIGKDGAHFTPGYGGTIAREGARSIDGYADHLRDLGMSDAQIRHLAETRQLPDTVDVVSPADGFIIGRNVTPGMHFSHMMEFYRIADLSKVWVVAEVDDQEAPYLKPGTVAQIALRDESRQLSARVTDSLPQSETGGGTTKVRFEADNPGFVLRPQMLVDVQVALRSAVALTIPVDALIDTGGGSRVYVERSDGFFEPRQVEIGWRDENHAEILHGLKPGERIVVAAAFLVDSQARLENAVPAVMPGSAAQKSSKPPMAAHDQMHEHIASAGTNREPL